MVTVTTNAGSYIWDIRGLKDDVKPVDNVPNGSTYYEIDGEHNIWMFNGDTKTWVPQ